MNVELLEKVEQKLRRLRHKRHFHMATWGEKNDCGTTACIAGHALLMEGYKIPADQSFREHEQQFISPSGRMVKPFNAARKILGLTESQAEKLFAAYKWPIRFGGGPCPDMDPNDPKRAAARIRHFIETGGKE